MQLPAQGEANKSTTNTLTFLLCYATLICVIRTPAEVENAPLMLLASCCSWQWRQVEFHCNNYSSAQQLAILYEY